jgi:hypothetical protein
LTVPSGGLAARVTAMLKSEAAQAAARMPNELRETVNGFMRLMWGLEAG